MRVIAHNRIGANIHTKDLSKKQYSVLYPLPTVFVTAVSLRILATQESPANAAGYAMIVWVSDKLIRLLRGLGIVFSG
tara:strand:- start:394 stop:627 length:234 start_codon:yes stop_codon:yes gene_type:complete